MFSLPNGKVTAAQILLPVSLVAFVVFLFLAFQFTQVMRDRDAMHQALAQQDKPMEDVQKLQAQLNSLAIGTQKLADNGDKDAKAIIDRMNKLGISVNMPPAGTPDASSGASPVPPPTPTKAMMPKAPKAAH
jgi:hypothetical protein